MPIPVQNEILCYPITSVTKPIDLFAPFPKQMQSYVPSSSNTPPNPPKRISSKDKIASLKAIANGQNELIAAKQSKPSDAKTISTIPERTTMRSKNRTSSSLRSRSASSLTTSFTSLKDEKNFANHSRVAAQHVERVTSLSPVGRKIEKRKSNTSPIAFGRSISKERTFAEEKRKQEEKLPLCRRAWTASTNILRDPYVQSPREVRAAVRSTYRSPQTRERITTTTSTKKNSAGNTVKVSAVTYTKDKLLKDLVKNNEKTVRMTTVEGKSKDRCSPPIFVKSNLSKTSVKTETKLNPRSKQTTKTSSNISLARTNSTFSIESNSAKRKIRNRPFSIKSAAKVAAPPVTISSKSSQKKCKIDDKKSATMPRVKTSFKDKSMRSISPTRNVGYERSNSFILIKDNKNQKQQNGKNDKAIGTKSNRFFQNLFLRNIELGGTFPKSETMYQNTAVQEKAQFYDTIPRRSNTIKKRPQSIYLTQKQPVTESKFRALDNEHLYRQSRSLSPRRTTSNKPIYFDRFSSKLDSFYQLSDEDEEEFGFVCFSRFEERSRSEPRSITYIQSTAKAINNKNTAAAATVDKNKQSDRPFSPTREVRSPSSRRIQSFRAQNKSECQQIDSHRRYHSLDSHLIRHRQSSCIDADNYENHLELCSHRRNERFKDLNRFYSNVERVGQLERATSNTDLHPIRKENELIDFDVWKRVRDYEKAERELNSLVGKLKKDEQEKDFLFRPKYVEDLKWSSSNESGLRVKEKSVEDLKEIFIEKTKQNHFDELKRKNIELSKDKYRSLWRGNSVLDLASSMTVKYNNPADLKSNHHFAEEKSFGISRNLISTLSKDQVSKIKNQLTEIYSNNKKTFNSIGKVVAPSEEYIINVSEEHNIRPTSLIVRSNSLVGEKELLKPVIQRQENRLKNNFKADSIGAVHETRVTRSVDRYDSIVRRQVQIFTEEEKRKLLQQLGNEICDKIKERREKILQPKETRGAIAAECTSKKSSQQSIDVALNSSLPSNKQTIVKSKSTKPTYEVKSLSKCNRNENEKSSSYVQTTTTTTLPKAAAAAAKQCKKESKKAKPSSSKVAIESLNEKIKEKIEYFEKKKDEKPAKVIYLPRDDSSVDEDELIRMIDEKVNARRSTQEAIKAIKTQKQSNTKRNNRLCMNGLSTSASDLKEIFGEKESIRNLIEFRTPTPTNTDNQSKYESDATSVESFFRSRSISPIYNSMHSTLKKLPFEDLQFQYESATYRPTRQIFAVPPRRFKSDPSLNEINFRNQGPSKVVVKSHEAGDVSYITHKFELKKDAANRNSRSRTRRISSPTFSRVHFRKEDRLMPHIDIISKTIALKEAINRSLTPKSNDQQKIDIRKGEVKSICHKFEAQTSPDRVSLIGQMYTSSPDISELKDISNYLSSTWIAHKYSKPNDNARCADDPEKGPASHEIKRKLSTRSNSISPPRTTTQNVTEMLKPLYDIFADQNYDPLKHRPIHRYVPIDKRIEAEYLWRRLKQQSNGNKKNLKLSGESKG